MFNYTGEWLIIRRIKNRRVGVTIGMPSVGGGEQSRKLKFTR